jgi:GNAT superfamily N-acetyltransferase
MRLRDYHRSDFELVWELDQECFPPGIAYSRSELRAFLSQKTAEAIVAERDGRVVGFVLVWRRSGIDGHVITLDVAASARRQGLGRRLLVELERRFRAAAKRRQARPPSRTTPHRLLRTPRVQGLHTDRTMVGAARVEDGEDARWHRAAHDYPEPSRVRWADLLDDELR